MSEAVAGLIGAAIGGGAAISGAWLQARNAATMAREQRADAKEESREGRDQSAADRRQTLARRYLFGLQDATESLRRRLQNWADRGGHPLADSHDPGYWDITTLYAVARALAAERILALEAVYPALETDFPELVEFYKAHGVDAALSAALGESLLRYHRLALAEAALERESDGFRILTYTEFRRRYETPEWGLQLLLEPATAAIKALTQTQMLNDLEQGLDQIVERLESVTGVPRIDKARSVGI